MQQNLYFIPLIPLVAFVIIVLFGSKMQKASAWISILAAISTFVLSVPLIIMTFHGQTAHFQWTWMYWGNEEIKLGLSVDSLSAMMLFIVTFIGSLIQIYSVGYMKGDSRYSWYFAYLSLFFFSMLLIVLADNLLLLYAGWELVGLCSYLLIGFWFEKPAAAKAGFKAFITNRIGDVGFLLGIITLYWTFHSFEFSTISKGVAQYAGPSLTIGAILLFCGAVGKSAQFPLHVWLPDAMEGPTPVSALIHAATMVAAGVYMIARMYFLFHANPHALQVIAYIGCFTAFMAATIAITQTDIKRILAYSTISQLGYMVMALGVGGYISGPFHLMTHAFFKALLFLGAGCVIHGTGTQDIREMGGLWKKMPTTAWTFLLATLAISGFPLFSGFWSKDDILADTFNSPIPGNMILYWVGTITAFITAFYMFRLFFLTFTGEQRNLEIHPHESPAIMTIPLIILAFFSVIAGFPGSPLFNYMFQHWLSQSFPYMPVHGEEINFGVMGISIVVGLAGIGFAWLMYYKKSISAEKIATSFSSLYQLSLNKWYWDEIYRFLIIKPFNLAGVGSYAFDVWIVDGAINGIARVGIWFALLDSFIDKYIIDGLVNLTGWFVQGASKSFRLLQTGLVQNYILMLVFGLTLILWIKILQNTNVWVR